MPFDPNTGRDVRVYPPDPQVDFQHLKLDLRMDDPMSRSFTCTETLTFKTAGRAISHLDLDAVELGVSKVSDLGGSPLKFRTDDAHLVIDFGRELPPQSDGGVVIEYSVHDPKTGMIFALPDESYKDRPLMIHTQGETEMNRYWFASHDFPNERFTSEIIVTIPTKYKALSNGKLVAREEIGDGKVRYHYSLAKPHVSYLVSLVIGEFDVVDDRWRDVPVEYWVPPGQRDRAMATFGKTPKMMELFSKLTGADYPYEKYAQSVVYNFSAGGMENTSCTTLTETAVLDDRAFVDQDQEGLISHELAHQWFGDMITCKSWPHVWLNEGFATYMNRVWDEHEKGRDEYDYDTWRTMRGVAESDKFDPRGGIVWPYYEDSGQTLGRRGSNPYSKGSSALHMLRQQLGDELFWQCIAEYVKRMQWKQAESDDLRKTIEDLSGQSYERIFQQWIYRAGCPEIEVSYDWDDDAHEAHVTLSQKQPISAEAPAFAANVDVWLIDESGNVDKRAIWMDQRESSGTFKCDRGEPKQIVVDPNCGLIAKWNFDLPTRMLAAQATGGPTTIARLHAIAALGGKDRDSSRQALRSVLADSKLYYGLRDEAAASLGRMQHDGARDVLLDALSSGVEGPKVRRAVVEALGKYRDPRVATALLPIARKDAAYDIEAAASMALGSQDPTDEIIETLLANSKKQSWRDQIRTAAVAALAELGDERGVAPAVALASYGQPYRSRANAIESLAKLAKNLPDSSSKSKDEIRELLVKLTRDPQDRAARSAVSALGELGDPKAVPALQKLADSASSDEIKHRARAAITAIHEKWGESTQVKSLRERIEALEREGKQRREHSSEEREGKTNLTTRPAAAAAGP
jgi:aminopeptidase N